MTIYHRFIICSLVAFSIICCKSSILSASTGDKEPVILKSNSFTLKLNKETGWPVQISSLNPSPCDLLNTREPFIFAIRDTSTGTETRLSDVESMKHGKTSISFNLSASGQSFKESIAGKVTYSLDGEMLRCSAGIDILKDCPGSFEVRFGFGMKPDDWQAQVYPGIPHEHVIRYKDGAYIKDYNGHDITLSGNLLLGNLPKDDTEMKSDIPWASLIIPMGVVERPDRLLAFARFDTGQPMMFRIGEGKDHGTFPLVVRFPKDLKKGQTITFDLAFKSFPRPQNNYAQVMTWFLDNVYSSNPNTKKSVGRKFAKVPPRPLPSGLNSWGCVGSKPKPGTVLPVEQLMVDQKMAMPFWISSWSVFDELYPLDDRPYFDEVGTRWTKEEIRAEIKRQMDAGLHVLMYRRNWLIWENLSDDRPPYKKWALNWHKPVEELAIETQSLAPEVQEAYGVQKIHKVFADLSIPEYRDIYVKQVLGELEYYKPAGQWWDMADSGQTGLIDAMRCIREGAAEQYPNIRIMGNEKCWGVDGLYCDGLAIESYEIGGKSERAFQAAKAFKRPIINLVYSVYYQNPVMWLPESQWASDVVTANDVRYFAMRYRLDAPITTQDSAVISVRQISWRDGAKIPLIQAKDMIADGQWHNIVIELAGKVNGSPVATSLAVGHDNKLEVKSEKAYITTLFIDMPQASSRLDIDSYGFYYDKPSTKGVLSSEKNGCNSMYFDDFSSPGNWQTPLPEIIDGYARFVSNMNSAVSWMKTDLRPLYRAYAKGLGYGALPGLGPVEPNMPILQPLFDFANDGLRLVPVAEPLADKSSPVNVKASLWCGPDLALMAAYNERRNPVMANIKIDLDTLKDNYGFKGNFDVEDISIFNADTGTRPADKFNVRIDKQGKAFVTGLLRGNELLMIRAR